MENELEQQPAFQCPDCGRVFTRQASLTKHVNAYALDPKHRHAWTDNDEPGHGDVCVVCGMHAYEHPQSPVDSLEFKLRRIFDEVYQYGGTGIAGAKQVMELYEPLIARREREAERRGYVAGYAASDGTFKRAIDQAAPTTSADTGEGAKS